MISVPPLVERANPHYARLGGRDAVVRLVQAFYAAMASRPEARAVLAMHPGDLGETQRVLVAYLCEWLGGPKDYSAERGTPRLRRRHQPFDIDAAARDAWLACMRQALEETCPDAELRETLMSAFARVAEAVRNTEPGAASRAVAHAPIPSTRRSFP